METDQDEFLENNVEAKAKSLADNFVRKMSDLFIPEPQSFEPGLQLYWGQLSEAASERRDTLIDLLKQCLKFKVDLVLTRETYALDWTFNPKLCLLPGLYTDDRRTHDEGRLYCLCRMLRKASRSDDCSAYQRFQCLATFTVRDGSKI